MLDDEVIDEQDDTIADMDDDEPPWGATMEVGGETYAVSLFWQPLSDPDNPMSEVKETAESVLDGADVFVLRGGGASQYGLGILEEGHAAGQSAAAIALAEHFADKTSFVSVFKVSEGWWFLAVRNDLILSEEDVLYLNEEDAQRAFFSMMAVPDWGHKIAPEEWDVENTEEGNLEEILRNTKAAKLTRLSSVRGTKFMVMIGAAVLVSAYILMQILGAVLSGDDEPMKTLVPPKIFKKIAPVQEKETLPWESLYDTSELLRHCNVGMQNFKISIPGWTLGKIACDGTGVSTKLTRTYGRVSWLQNAFKQSNINIMKMVIDASGSSAIAMASVKKVQQIHSYPILSEKQTKWELNEIFQAIGIKISLANKQTQSKASSGLVRSVKKKIYPVITFSYTSNLEPIMWESVLTAFSGLEISNIIWDWAKNTWQYEGVIYVKSDQQ